jgi:hypothetical protein
MRLFMVPHVVKNQIIAKTTTDLIPCRISVCGDAEHIESTTGTKERDFPQKLPNMGDMAVRFGNDPTFFVHSAVLAPSNDEMDELFDFLARFWSKIEPDSVANSVMAKPKGVLTSSSDDTLDVSNTSESSMPRKNITVSMGVEKTPSRKISSEDYASLKRLANADDFDDMDNSLENLFG